MWRAARVRGASRSSCPSGPEPMAAAAALPHLRRARQLWIERLTGAIFAVPAFILLLLVNLLPLIAVLYLSLTNYEFGALDAGFVGLANLKKALADPIIRRSV